MTNCVRFRLKFNEKYDYETGCLSTLEDVLQMKQGNAVKDSVTKSLLSNTKVSRSFVHTQLLPASCVIFPIPVSWQKSVLMITSQVWFKQFNSVLNPQNFTTHPSVKLIEDRDTLVNFNFVPVSSSHVSTILHKPDPKKAVGVDGISSRLLRLSAPGIVNESTKLINFFINSQS